MRMAGYLSYVNYMITVACQFSIVTYSTQKFFMPTKTELIKQIADARKKFIDAVSKFSESDSKWKATNDSWCATEITEHLFWAEQGGILGMWKSLQANRVGKKIWEGEETHKGLSIEEIIDKTWKEKEIVPTVAAPRFGGP